MRAALHLGDITKICGYDVPPVDCVIGGSPCQDLSIAGKREGLAGARSGLFMEQIRIVKEMREADRLRGRTGQFVRPRYMVWENVPGAFSSNGGEDFRAVLEETIRIADPDAPDVPLPPKGKWPLADAWYGDGWSVAYRVLDAQFWGVPQRRRRIALVADFGGQSAPEILFERESVSWHTPQSGEARQGTSPGAESGANTASGVQCLTPWDIQSARVYGEDGAWHSLNANENGGMSRDAVLAFTQNQRNEVRDLHDVAGSLAAEPGMKQQTFVCAGFKAGNGPKANGIGYEPEKAPTLSAANSGTNQVPAVISFNTMVCTRDGEHEKRTTCGISEPNDPMFTLSAAHSRAVLCMATGKANAEIMRNKSPTIVAGHEQPIVAHTLRGKGNDPYREDAMTYPVTNGSVRRLTPTECERLQGFPSTKKLDVSKMTKDEYIAWNLSVGNIVADCEHGKVFATRGPGGVSLDKPKELEGSIVNGYRVVSIRNGTTKLQCRVHRIIWISAHGILPDGYCIDHINNDKQDNRLSNLQLLTPAENSTKASEDGLYKTGEDNAATKLSPDLWDEIAYLYDFTDFTIRDLAEIYGVSKSRIHQIIKEVGWTDIGEWTDSKGKVHQTSDAARYKAMGNSIALPPWKWVLKRLCACYERDATMASLFDGVGGFPLIWERLNGPGTCLWASEIEPFCVAVTTRHFNKA